MPANLVMRLLSGSGPPFQLPELRLLAEGVERTEGGEHHPCLPLEDPALEDEVAEEGEWHDEKKLYEARSPPLPKPVFGGDRGVVVVLADAVGDRLRGVMVQLAFQALDRALDEHALVHPMLRDPALAILEKAVDVRRPRVAEADAISAEEVYPTQGIAGDHALGRRDAPDLLGELGIDDLVRVEHQDPVAFREREGVALLGTVALPLRDRKSV